MIECGERNLFRTLETDRLILREITTQDAEDLYKNIYNNFEWYKFCYTRRYSSLDEFTASLNGDRIKYKVGNYFRWGVVEKKSGKMIGEVRLHSRDFKDNRFKIGYLFSYNHQNKGYATEAITEVVNFSLNKINVSKIQAEIVQKNEASLHLVKRIGMKYEKTMRYSYKLGDQYYDQDVFCIINPDYESKILVK